VRLPEGAHSRALLIGTGAYEHLPGVPASRNNLRALADTLQQRTGLPPGHCRRLLDPPDLAAVGREVEEATGAATDLLLVYYSGHGLIDSGGKLHLALPQTSQRLLPWSGMPFEFLHEAIQHSAAATKVLILDCCFSGIATELLGSEEGAIMGQIRVTGTFTLTSSPANSPSYAFEGRRHTAFTEALLTLLEEGSPRAGRMLTLNDIYLELLRNAREHGLPLPQKCGTHTADMLPLAYNLWEPRLPVSAVTAPSTVETPANRLVGVGPTPDPGVPTDPQWPPVQPFLTEDDVRNVLFKTVRLSDGYDEDEVDAFLDKVIAAMREPMALDRRMLPDEVRRSEFTTTRLREGYDIDEVDTFLDRVELEFERRLAWVAKHAEADREGRAL
jgi:DivIVA domain-containing protein